MMVQDLLLLLAASVVVYLVAGGIRMLSADEPGTGRAEVFWFPAYAFWVIFLATLLTDGPDR